MILFEQLANFFTLVGIIVGAVVGVAGGKNFVYFELASKNIVGEQEAVEGDDAPTSAGSRIGFFLLGLFFFAFSFYVLKISSKVFYDMTGTLTFMDYVEGVGKHIVFGLVYFLLGVASIVASIKNK